MKFKSAYDMPYNINKETETNWENFVLYTNQGDSRNAILAFHKYLLSKERTFDLYRKSFEKTPSSQDMGIDL